jgi:hypothetical protein
MERETWSAPARRKIAPGQADRLTGCATCKELPESRYTQQRHIIYIIYYTMPILYMYMSMGDSHQHCGITH